MKLKWKKAIAGVMAVVMLGAAVDLFPQPMAKEAFAAEKSDTVQTYNTAGLQPDMTDNLNDQNYHTYGNLVSSYLVEEEGAYMRVQFVAGKSSGSAEDVSTEGAKKDLLLVEYYDEQFQLNTQKYIEEENKLESLAGFYAGSGYYYVVWKQNLDEENWSADQTFMRVLKYDKTWQLQGSVDLNSDNGSFCGSDSNGGVVYPCEAGSLRMAEYGGHLYINSCYKGVDGHQRSMMFDLVEPDLSPVQTDYALAYYYAWVSHSYNQFLLIDEGLSPGRMVTLNHGDGGDHRGSALGQYELDTEYKTVSKSGNKEITTFSCVGGEDASGSVRNYTGASLGGLERSEASYLVAGNSIEQEEETFLTSSQRNIFVTATSRTDPTIENTKVYWLTDHVEGEEVEVSTPQLVKMNDTRFLVIWREGKQIPHETGTLKYRFVDADGRPQGETKTAAGEITDCKPVVKDGKAVWYSSSGNEGVYFYTIDSQGTFEVHGVNTVAGVPTVNKVELQKEGVYLEWEPVSGADGYCIIKNQKQENAGNTGYGYVEVLTNYETTYIEGGSTCSYLDRSDYTDGFPYEYRVCSYKICNDRKILSYGCEKIERWLFKGVQYFSAIENVASGIKLSWKPYNPYFNPSEFRIYRSRAGETEAELLTIVKGAADRYENGSVESFIDTTAEGGVAYDYSIETRRGEGVSARFVTTSYVRVETPQIRAVCNSDNTVTVSWSKASGAEKYYLRPYIWNEARQAYTSTDLPQSMSPDNLSCTVSGLKNGTKYQFGVIGKSKLIQTPSMTGTYGFDSEEAKKEITTYENPAVSELQTPSFTVVENASEGMKLAWSSVEGADGYELSIYNSTQGLRDESLASTAYLDKNVTDGQFYMYKIRAYAIKDGNKIYSAWSEAKNVKYQKPVPTARASAEPTATPGKEPVATSSARPVPTTAPEGKRPGPEITSIKNTENGVLLTWDEVEGATDYYIYYYDSDDGKFTFVGNTSKLDYTDTGVEEGKTYYYVVNAWIDKEGFSDISNIASIVIHIPGGSQPVSPTLTPSAPVMDLQSLSCFRDMYGSGIELQWKPVEGADGYVIFAYEDGVQMTGQTIVGGDTKSHRFYNLKEKAAYVFYMAAYQVVGSEKVIGDRSEEKSIVFIMPSEAISPGPGTATPSPGAATSTPGAVTPGPGTATPGPGAATPSPGAATPSPTSTVDPLYPTGPFSTVSSEPTGKPNVTVEPESTEKPQSTVEIKGKKPAKPVIKELKNRKGKKVKLTLSKKVSGAAGYQVAYAAKSSMKGQKKKNFKSLRVTVQGLKQGKTYYFRVRAYTKRNGKMIYGSWGKKKRIKIKR